MSNDDKYIDVQLICYQRVATYNKFRGMNPMESSAPWDKSPEIISLHPVKKVQGMKPMGVTAPWDDSLEMISLWTVINLARY